MRFKTCFFAALFLVVCGNLEAANKTSSTTSARVKSSNISGQVFIVTQGRENIKLALVEISAIPEKDIIQYLDAKHRNGLEQQKVLMPELESAKKEYEAAQVERKIAHEISLEATGRYTNRGNTYAEQKKIDAEYSKVLEESNRTNHILVEKEKYYRKVKIIFDMFDSAEYYLEALPTPIGISKTDVDGKFTLSLPPGKYAITAKSSRKVFAGSESYCWFVWVDTSHNQSLILSNDNLLETKCKECVWRPLQ